MSEQPPIQLAYVGLEVSDPTGFGSFLNDVVGLLPGLPTSAGELTWRNDSKVQRLIVDHGEADDATTIGFEARDTASFNDAATRMVAAGYELIDGTAEHASRRRVAEVKHTMSPWGVRVELTHQLAQTETPFDSPLVPSGFLTDGVGFGHLVFATTAFEEGHRFATEGLGMRQTDWLEMELAPGIDLEVRFYHCNPRHHTLALARAPFELPQKLHHLMVEVNDADDVGRAFDRAWNSGLGIANGLGRHDNDGMFSFYVVTPAGFQLEFGHGARVVHDPWPEDRRYDQISRWGHQPLSRD